MSRHAVHDKGEMKREGKVTSLYILKYLSQRIFWFGGLFCGNLDHTHFCRYLIYFVLCVYIRQLRIMVSYISGIDSSIYSLLGERGPLQPPVARWNPAPFFLILALSASYKGVEFTYKGHAELLQYTRCSITLTKVFYSELFTYKGHAELLQYTRCSIQSCSLTKVMQSYYTTQGVLFRAVHLQRSCRAITLHKVLYYTNQGVPFRAVHLYTKVMQSYYTTQGVLLH